MLLSLSLALLQAADLEKMRGEHLESSLSIASLRNDLQEAQAKGDSADHSVRSLQLALSSIKSEAESAEVLLSFILTALSDPSIDTLFPPRGSLQPPILSEGALRPAPYTL